LEDGDSLGVCERLKECVMELDVLKEYGPSSSDEVLLFDGLGCIPLSFISFSNVNESQKSVIRES